MKMTLVARREIYVLQIKYTLNIIMYKNKIEISSELSMDILFLCIT